jgi:DNA-binding GntR family transcriptional regulator
MTAAHDPVPLQDAPVADHIALRLIRDIMRGVYRPGERIREQEVADRLGVSRGPVREALRMVEQDGLVENTAWKGARVVLLALNDVEDLFLLTAALMAVVARLVVRRATDDELAEFARRVEAHAPTSDPSRPIQEQLYAAFALGAYLFQIARSPQLNETVARVVRLIYWQHRVLNGVEAEWRLEAVETWRRLAAVLFQRDAARAERAINAVDRHSRQRVLQIHRQLGGSVYGLFGPQNETRLVPGSE